MPQKVGLHKIFRGTTKKCENKNLTSSLFQYNFQKCTGGERLTYNIKLNHFIISMQNIVDLIA